MKDISIFLSIFFIVLLKDISYFLPDFFFRGRWVEYLILAYALKLRIRLKKHSMSSYSCVVKKIGLPENRLRVYEQKSPIDRFQSAKLYCTSEQYCILISKTNHVTALRTNQSTMLLWSTNIFLRSGTLHGRFLLMHAQTILRQADFLTPQLLLDKLWLSSVYCIHFNEIQT